MAQDQPAIGLRERTRRAVRAELSRLAMELFRRNGFEETTVDEIATAAGVSKRSFFRYFATKEDAVLADVDLLGEEVRAQLRARPDGEEPWDSLRAVLGNWAERIHAAGATGERLVLIESAPALRAKYQQKRERLRDDIAVELRRRCPEAVSAFELDLVTGAAAAALDAVSRELARGAADGGELIERAFAALRPRSAAD